MTEPIIQKIKSGGYWFINIRPLKFQKERLGSLHECATLIETSSLHLRGWPYPFVKPERIQSGIDWVQCQIDWEHYIEHWRMYQSGLFAHLFACEEDWWTTSHWVPNNLKKVKPMSVMSVLMTLFRFTEIYEFAARLAEKNIFDEAVSFTVELHGMKGRKLVFIERIRRLFHDYVCTVDDLPLLKVIPVEDMLGRAHELAIDHTLWVLERFNWRSASRDILKQNQKKLLEQRR